MAGPTTWYRLLAALLVIALPLVVLACGGSLPPGGEGGGDASADGQSKAKVLIAVQVAPATASIAIGTTQQFTARGVYSDGSTEGPLSRTTWASSDEAVATIDARGLAVALTEGTTAIRATRGTITGSATLTVGRGGPPPSLQVTPAMAENSPGCNVPFKATATSTGGKTADVTKMAVWTSSDPTVATVGASTGIATPLKFGRTATITATYGGQTGSATLTVGGGLSTVQVTPFMASCLPGLTQQFSAAVKCTDGTVANVTSTASWMSSSPTTATISATGLATCVSTGMSNITATVGSETNTAILTVPALPMSLTVTPNPATATPGGLTVQFKATALYTDGTSADVTTSAAWTSSANGVATVGVATGLATPLSSGTAAITATYMGVSGTATLVVVCTSLSVTGVTVTPASASIVSGATQPFTAIATFSDGSMADVTSSATWMSSLPSTATVSSTGLATGVAMGTTTITATLTFGCDTKSGTATLTVTP